MQERQALLLWFQGMSKASVGRRMSITENTVRQYIDRARMKYAALGRPALSKDALLARAIEDGIITPREVATYTSRASRDFPTPAGATITAAGQFESLRAAAICCSSASRPTSGQVLATAGTTPVTRDILGPGTATGVPQPVPRRRPVVVVIDEVSYPDTNDGELDPRDRDGALHDRSRKEP